MGKNRQLHKGASRRMSNIKKKKKKRSRKNINGRENEFLRTIREGTAFHAKKNEKRKCGEAPRERRKGLKEEKNLLWIHPSSRSR